MSKDDDNTDTELLHSKYSVTREVYTVNKFSEEYHRSTEVHKPFSLSAILRSCTCSRFLSVLSSIFPFYSVLASFYTFQSFLSDVVAGITMSIVHVPQGMAYGLLAGAKPINGLYTSFFPALVYFFFSTSRHVSVGTFAVVALLTSDPVDRLVAKFDTNNRSLEKYQVFNETHLDDFRVKIVVTVCILGGIFQLLLGIFRLGMLVVYMSAPLLGGFTCASAVHVFASQLNGLFGIRLNRATGPGRIFFILINFVKVVSKTNLATLLMSCICIITIWIFRHFINPRVTAKIRFAIPIELIVLAVCTIISEFCSLNEKYGVAIVGKIPVGLPSPIVPDVKLIPEVLMDSVIISFVALATTISLVKLYATKEGYDVGYTQELTALGMANIISGFFRCQPASGALARSSVAYGVGMCSQVACLISCSIILLVVTFVGQFLQSVPMCTLSSIIVVSLETIILQILDLPKLYRVSVYDMLIWLVTFLATTCIDVPIGLVTGLGFSLLTVLYRTQSSYYYELGQIPGTNIYVDVKKYDEAIKLPHIIMLKYGGPLYYANAESFQNWLNKMTQIDPHKLIKQRQRREKRQKEQLQKKKTEEEEEHKQQSNGEGDDDDADAGNAEHPSNGRHSFTCGNLFACMKCKKKQKTTADSQFNALTITDSDVQPNITKQLKFIILDISSWTYLDVVGMRTVTDVSFFCKVYLS
ncbi:unnamed protein product [Trichobilharzia szidati]|nr:unnamed protein product [Trichobilharzia szidati]